MEQPCWCTSKGHEHGGRWAAWWGAQFSCITNNRFATKVWKRFDWLVWCTATHRWSLTNMSIGWSEFPALLLRSDLTERLRLQLTVPNLARNGSFLRHPLIWLIWDTWLRHMQFVAHLQNCATLQFSSPPDRPFYHICLPVSGED